MAHFKEPSEKESNAFRSFNDILCLLLKLNEKLRDKFGLSPRKRKESASDPWGVVIMILRPEEGSVREEKNSKSAKPKLPSGAWIDRMIADIEGKVASRKKD
jgi:hypothetical protein